MAASFDKDIMFQWGSGMGKEFKAKGSNVQLGPGLCLARELPRSLVSGSGHTTRRPLYTQLLHFPTVPQRCSDPRMDTTWQGSLLRTCSAHVMPLWCYCASWHTWLSSASRPRDRVSGLGIRA